MPSYNLLLCVLLLCCVIIHEHVNILTALTKTAAFDNVILICRVKFSNTWHINPNIRNNIVVVESRVAKLDFISDFDFKHGNKYLDT